MDLTLSEQEVDLLRRILTGYLGDLRMEIVDTDNHEYKQGLRDEKAALEALVARLAG